MSTENYDDIKKMFGEEHELPESLSKESITEKIMQKNIKPKRNLKVLPKIAACAAALAVVCAGAFAIGNIPYDVNFKSAEKVSEAAQTQQESTKVYDKIEVGVEAKALSKFSSNEDLKNYFLNIAKENSSQKVQNYFSDSFLYGAKADDEAMDMFSSNTSASFDSSYSKTNTQVEGIDEADIVKNDGRYLYIASSLNKLTVFDTESMQAVFSKELEAQEDSKTFEISQMYLNEDRLVVLGCEYEEQENENSELYDTIYSSYSCCSLVRRNNIKSVCVIYDVSDKANPKRLRYVTQDGDMASSRMIGSVIYLVTEYWVDTTDKSKTENSYAPEINGEKLNCEDIYVTDKASKYTGYVVVCAFDTADADSEISKSSLLGSYDEIYCSQNTLYVTSQQWQESTEADAEGMDTTNIYAFSLDGATVSYKGTGAVPGYIDSQYSLDENGGFLRIATTDYNYDTDTDISSIYVFDSSLNVVGKLVDIAKDEQIKSVRYMGQYAYVVTFRNTDPLFVIDLSDPSKPQIKGEVKLPGFSEYLHVVGDGLLLGIGYDGDEENENFNNVKISLFDVSDPTVPKEIDSHTIKNASTEVNNDPKAFLYYEEENIIGIPLQYDVTDSEGNVHGVSYQYKLMSIENGKFSEKKNFVHPSDESGWYSYLRGAYIGSTLYTVTDLSVASFDMQSGEMIKAVSFDQRKAD